MTTPIVNFRTLADGNVIALTGNFDAVAVNVDKVIKYMSKIKEVTGGIEVEFNNTFRQFCKDRVFYTFEPINNKNIKDFLHEGHVSDVVECVLLTDNRVAMNVKGNVTLLYPEEGNALYKTKEDALEVAKKNAFDMNSKYLDELTAKRKELKEMIHVLNKEIETRIEFKKSL